MGKKSSSIETVESTQTTESTLAILTTHITEFVRNGTLDSRCAVKLAKRLRKEANDISANKRATIPGQKALQEAFDALDTALRENDAMLLVQANAVLRASDTASGAGKKTA